MTPLLLLTLVVGARAPAAAAPPAAASSGEEGGDCRGYPGCALPGCAEQVTCSYQCGGRCPSQLGFIAMPCTSNATCDHPAYTCFGTIPTCNLTARTCTVGATAAHLGSEECCASADGRTCDAPPPPVHVGLERQLFVDDKVIGSLSKSLQVLNSPTKVSKPVLDPYPRAVPGTDMLGIFEGTVHYNEAQQQFELWYMPCTQSWHHCWLAYATSTDGRSWARPMLNIISFNGSTANNLVFDSPQGEIMPAIVVDPPARAGPDGADKYKLLHRILSPQGFDGGCLAVSFSADGKHWRRATNASGMTIDCVIHTADTCSQVIWSEARQKYLATTRDDSSSATRSALISESSDFLSWTPVGHLASDALDLPWQRELYDMPFMEVPDSGGLLIGCLNIYHIISAWEGTSCPPSPRAPWFDRLSYQLTSTRLANASVWSRAANRQVFLPNGHNPTDPDYGILWMYSSPLQINDTIYFFYSGFEGTHWAVARNQYQGGVVMAATLRRDGWVSVDAATPGAELLTRFFRLDQNATRLLINANTVADEALSQFGNGSIAMEVQDQTGKAVNGFTLGSCLPMSGTDAIEWEVRWLQSGTKAGARKRKGGWAALRGEMIRLRFVMGRAKLYAFQFRAG